MEEIKSHVVLSLSILGRLEGWVSTRNITHEYSMTFQSKHVIHKTQDVACQNDSC